MRYPYLVTHAGKDERPCFAPGQPFTIEFQSAHHATLDATYFVGQPMAWAKLTAAAFVVRGLRYHRVLMPITLVVVRAIALGDDRLLGYCLPQRVVDPVLPARPILLEMIQHGSIDPD